MPVSWLTIAITQAASGSLTPSSATCGGVCTAGAAGAAAGADAGMGAGAGVGCGAGAGAAAGLVNGLFGGGGGAGVSISPIAFLVIQNGNVRTIQLADHASTVDRALNMVPELVDKLSELLKKDKEEKPGGEATE